ncbi:glycosyltransferase [Metapseudomonas otitidis]|uniref:glycosyltransferase n=1 Tax=Metapseudomonas otitidis TaxID=319939 RepID=UPI003A89F429
MSDKFSILVLLPLVPFPPDDGGKIASYTFIENLRRKHDFTVLVPVRNVKQAKLVDDQRKLWPEVKIISAECDGGGLLGKLLRFIDRCFLSIKKAAGLEFGVFSDKNLVCPFLEYNADYFEVLKKILCSEKFDIVQSEYVQNLSLVDFLPKESRKIYVEVESRYSLLEDYASLEPPGRREYCAHIASKVKSIEATFLEKYDAVIAYNADDQLRLQQLLPRKVVYKSPLNLIRDSSKVISFSGFSIDKILFIGHEQHSPNKDAVEWFIEEIYPHVSRFGKKFYVLGRWSKGFVNKYSKVPGVVFTGFVDDIEGFIRGGVNVAPIRLGGGGIRIKVLLSISNGVPVVCTSKACYGFDFVHGHNSMIAETASDFVASLSKLLGCNELGQKLAKNAYQLYMESYSVESTTKIREEIYSRLVNG